MASSTDNLPPPVRGASALRLAPLSPLKPDLYQRAWASIPHPTLPLLATVHAKAVTIFSLSTLSAHSSLTGGHQRSVRSAAWKPGLPPHKLSLVTGSFDSTAGLWRWDGDVPFEGTGSGESPRDAPLEVEITNGGREPVSASAVRGDVDVENNRNREGGGDDEDWEFTLVLEGHDSEVKSVAFSPSGQFLATCSRDKSVWIWEDVGATEADDEWETVAVLGEHDGDVKAVAWCPDVPGRSHGAGARDRHGADVLASASYDNTVRVWREDADGEWVCVTVLEGHEGTVWGLQWEPAPRHDGFPRLLTWSADMTIRVWSLRDDPEEAEGRVDSGREGGGSGSGAGGPLFRSGLGSIPNTMRHSLREDWDCTAILPKAHTRDVYSAAWSADSGLVASTGSDGIIAVYREEEAEPTPAEPGPPADDDVEMAGDTSIPAGSAQPSPPPPQAAPTSAPASAPGSDRWRLLTTVADGHGPYEINHVTWCRRFDPGSERRGVEEMLVTTGDDGIVRPWQVITG